MTAEQQQDQTPPGPGEPGAEILWDVVEEHLEEAGFLWEQWEALSRSPRTSFPTLAGWEERLLAHIDGLVVSGASGAERLLLPVLADINNASRPVTAEKVFAASLALLAARSNDNTNLVVDCLFRATESSRRALIRALQLAHCPEVPQVLAAKGADLDLSSLPSVIDVLGFYRADMGRLVTRLTASASDPVFCSALSASQYAQGADARWFASTALTNPSVHVRGRAIEAGMVLGLPDAWSECTASARAPEKTCPQALLLLAMLGGEKGLHVVRHALGLPQHRRDAAWALGFSGRVEAADACIELMQDPELSRLAGDAFSAITGLEIDQAYSRSTLIEHHNTDTHSGSTQEAEGEPARPSDTGLVPRACELELPVPDAEKVKAWWLEQRTRFHPNLRYLNGRPYSIEAVCHALANGKCVKRKHVALEIAIRSGQMLLDTRDWSSRQGEQIRRIAELDPRSFQIPVETSLDF